MLSFSSSRHSLLRRLAALAATGVLGLALVPGHVSAHQPASRTTITYGRWGSADEIAAEKVLFKAFEKAHPSITVKEQVADWNTYWTKLPTQMAAGQAPDAFLMSA